MQLKSTLIAGIIISIIGSIFEIIFHGTKFELTFFGINLIGHIIFLFGLTKIDYQAKSSLFFHYLMLIAIFVIFKLLSIFLDTKDIGIFSILCILGIFLLVLYRYLYIFGYVMNSSLFIVSFYVFIVCILVGISLLSLDAIKHSSISAFIIGFIFMPSYIVYISAIFSITRVWRRKVF